MLKKSHSKRQQITEITILWFILMVFFFKFEIAYNEMDVIPYARSIFNPQWLTQDWYLNLKIPYRYFFSYPIGFFVESIGTVQTIFLGRILTYLLMATALYRLIQSIKATHFNVLIYFALILFFIFFPVGNGAGEWMIGGLDAKVFAYAFVILSLTAFLNQQIQKGLFFAGLALSFHLLIGFYHLFCLIPILIVYQNISKDFYLKVLKASPLFILSGSVGIFAIIYQLFISPKTGSNLGWDIYVNTRVNHHVLPSLFPFEIWIKLGIFTICNIFLYIKSKNNTLKYIASYALFSVLINLIGLCVFFFLDSHHLRYYFFRFSDIMLPLLTLLSMASFILEKVNSDFFQKKKNLSYSFSVLILMIISPQIKNFIADFTTSASQIKAKTSTDKKMEDWVKTHTDKSDVFIVAPAAEFFYINYERPVFATWKHAPQSNADIEEWYNRLKLLNKEKDFSSLKDLQQNYRNITENDIQNIRKKYPELSYILVPKSIFLDLPMHFTSHKHTLYDIRDTK